MQMLPFETPTQWIALVLALAAGWCIGFASAPGGRKWRERLRLIERADATYRARTDAELREARQRIGALEAENDRLSDGHPRPRPSELGPQQPLPAQKSARSAFDPTEPRG
jgi:hypothetical protein